MSRNIYKVDLDMAIYTATSEADVMEQVEATGMFTRELEESDEIGEAFGMRKNLKLRQVAGAELTRKLYLLAWQMYNTEMYDCNDVESCLTALMQEHGVDSSYLRSEIADEVIKKVECHLLDLSQEEFLDWLTIN